MPSSTARAAVRWRCGPARAARGSRWRSATRARRSSGTEHLFQAHTRGEGAPGLGSGMGLYIVRSIVQGWGGQAWAERQGGRNAFLFTLPGVAGLT